jgi:hypothetical protein
MFTKIINKAKWLYKYAKNHLTEVVGITGLGCGGGLLMGRWGALIGVALGIGLLLLANKVKDKE